jgi:predicted ATPase/DNA-binding SARP family transcriptional activator
VKPTHETARLTICLLGPTLIRLDQENVTAFGTDKARALLAYLAVEADRPHRRERLAGLLWPVRPERVARTNLRRALADLRRAIGDRETAPPFLHVKRGTIQFNNASDAWTDVTAFKQLLQIASSDRLIGLEAIQPLAEAVGLYRGAFLEGLSISDSAAFEEWALLQQEWLQREALTALSRLAGYYEELGDCESALPYAWRAANLDPWQEEARRRLMRLLTLSGQRAAALAQYEDCRRALIEELGVEPEEETTALYQQIRAQEFRPAATQPRVVPHNLRTPLTPFVGRETELTAIHARLNDPTCRLLTLIGPGGIGKTRVAVQVARDVASAPLRQTTFRDGVFFVPLVSVNPMGTVIPAIASALDLSFSGEINPELRWRDTGGLEDRLFNYLRAKQMLLVLDSFEHLLAPSAMPTSPPRVVAKPGRERDSVALITEILRAAPGVKILVTSREVLDLQPEWVYPLQGMDYPAVDGVPDEAVRLALEDYSAVALFAQCARRVCPAFSLAQAGEIAIRICQLVGGMPLAIELAASWLRHLSPDRIVAELERGLDILTTSWRDVPPRHRSVRAVFDYSWDLLSDKERCALQRLSVFRGGFGLQASEAVAGVSLPELGKLTEKSLLHASASERYEMHELFRQYCLEKLREDCSEEERTRDRHSDYYARFIQARGDALKGPHQKAAVVKMEIEIEDANVAWNWAAEHGHIERLDRMLEGMGLFYSWSSRAREGTVACQLAAEKITALISSHEPVLSTGHSRAEGLRVLARILAWQATLCSPDRAALAEQLLKRSLDLLEQAALDLEDTRSERAFVLLQMGQVAFATDLRRARAFYLDSLALYRMLDEQWWTARALQHLGWLAAYAGTYEESTRWHEESLAIRRGLGDARGIAESLKGLGTVLIVHGRPEHATGVCGYLAGAGGSGRNRWWSESVGRGADRLGSVSRRLCIPTGGLSDLP